MTEKPLVRVAFLSEYGSRQVSYFGIERQDREPRFTHFMYRAGEKGIEPLYTPSKGAVLPLDDSPALFTNNIDSGRADERQSSLSSIPSTRRSPKYF